MSTLVCRQRGEWFVVGFNADRLTDPAVMQDVQNKLFGQLSRMPLRGHVAISFEGVEHASSQVVGLLLGAKKMVDDRFGTLVLCRVGAHLSQILSITRLDSKFEIRERLRDVIAPTHIEARELVRAGGPGREEMNWID